MYSCNSIVNFVLFPEKKLFKKKLLLDKASFSKLIFKQFFVKFFLSPLHRCFAIFHNRFTFGHWIHITPLINL